MNNFLVIFSDTFDVDMGFALGQMAEYKATLNNKPLVNFVIKLDDVNFLKTTYNYDIDTFKDFIVSILLYFYTRNCMNQHF